ncbi:1-aminocyclopropane-1-carboxylate synthase-like protein 1 [Nerophis ophidion]|uniref:1-aminocyclopropane-1-carboxylate synthase-like protein 1 n=1 Tax=Nerophis ophidion TaxID=159077 RepID=UPI002ADF2C27|nr:1-aminocyclopropane-1-carboxylate synthase-like protein 1 [Nerophis ophidion]
MDPRGRRHERGSNWTDPEIVELLQLWSDESVQIELESSLRNQRVFDRIALVLREKGIYRSGDQCREKIKKMKLEYRRIKDNHKLRSWKFYDVMDWVLANRPAVTYSTLGGSVVAQQVFQSPCGSDSYVQGSSSAGAFGPASAGGFLFGQPPKMGDPLDVKCEDVEESLLNTDVPPPEMYYRSGDEQETDGQSLPGTEDTSGQGEHSHGHARMSPSGLTDVNLAGSASQSGSAPAPHETFKETTRPLASVRQRRRRRAGKTTCGHGSGTCGSNGPLDKALASFLVWQRCAEDRLLSLEEARLEKELQADERRQQQEEKRAEQERQHELRLFSMLTGALVAVRQGDATTANASMNISVSPLDHQSASGVTPTASTAPSSSQTHSPAPTPHTVCTKGTIKSGQSTSVKFCTIPVGGLATERGVKSTKLSVYLSNRGNSIRQNQAVLQEGFTQYEVNRYHETDNPNGLINMGTSENKLCYDLLHKRLTQPDMLHVDPVLLQYGDWRGHAFLREEVAKFLTYFCHSPKRLKADNVVVMNGCSSIFSCIAAVICDPKEAILIPSPFYGVITEDLQLYSDVQLFHVPLDCEDKEGRIFHLTVSKLEEGLQRAKQEGVNIQGLILMNPHNPLAEIYTPKEMLAFLEFAKRNKLHAIIDEVYMLTVFDESVTFHSVLSLESLPDPQRTHIMWGLSKDFAMAGNRVGTLYTENQDLVDALAKLGSFHGISGTTQHQVTQLLQDREWISKEFLPENRRRLKGAHRYVTDELQTMDIHHLDRPAALYVWADFRKFLRAPSFEEELLMWRCFLKHKVVLSCGQAFCCSTPGWFRIVFADKQHHLQLGLKRIREALEEIEERSANTEPFVTKEAGEESKRSVMEDSAQSNNAAIENSTSSPQSKSSGQLKKNASPVPVTGFLGPEDFVLQDYQAYKPAESLDSLIGTLKHQIRSSDWLEKNTPEQSAGEDPESFDVFKALLERVRK